MKIPLRVYPTETIRCQEHKDLICITNDNFGFDRGLVVVELWTIGVCVFPYTFMVIWEKGLGYSQIHPYRP